MDSCKSVTIGVPVPDLDVASAWYRDLLGDVEETSPAPGVRELQIMPACWLQLFVAEAAALNPSVLRLETDDIEACHLRVVALGCAVGEIELVPDAVRYFEFRDPFGNQLSFYEMI